MEEVGARPKGFLVPNRKECKSNSASQTCNTVSESTDGWMHGCTHGGLASELVCDSSLWLMLCLPLKFNGTQPMRKTEQTTPYDSSLAVPMDELSLSKCSPEHGWEKHKITNVTWSPLACQLFTILPFSAKFL